MLSRRGRKWRAPARYEEATPNTRSRRSATVTARSDGHNGDDDRPPAITSDTSATVGPTANDTSVGSKFNNSIHIYNLFYVYIMYACMHFVAEINLLVLERFIRILFLASLTRMSWARMYCSQSMRYPKITDVMPLARWETVKRLLHINKEDHQDDDGLKNQYLQVWTIKHTIEDETESTCQMEKTG